MYLNWSVKIFYITNGLNEKLMNDELYREQKVVCVPRLPTNKYTDNYHSSTLSFKPLPGTESINV